MIEILIGLSVMALILWTIGGLGFTVSAWIQGDLRWYHLIAIAPTALIVLFSAHHFGTLIIASWKSS